MAILQLSRITNRSGLQENLPQLSGAELGWSIDSRKLFIGNGDIVDGAPLRGNTEILTEFSDILSLSSTYTYRGLAGGYQVDTGGDGNTILRSLISKLDDIASVKDFGAIGNGIEDDTDAINRALFELFCRGPNISSRRGLLFPAGEYLVSDTIKVPPHAKIIGEGLGSSTIIFQKKTIAELTGGTDEIATGVYTLSEIPTANHKLVLLVNSAEKEEGTDFTIVGTTLTFITSIPVINDDIVVYTTAPYVMTTSDSKHDIVDAIGTSSGSQFPTGIEVASLALRSLENNTILLLNSVTETSFTSVSLKGPQTDLSSGGGTIDLDTAAIEIASIGGPQTSNITLSKMTTAGTTFALRMKDRAKGIVIESSKISSHYLGILLDRKSLIEANAEYNDFPTGVIATHNIFDNIALEAFKVQDMFDVSVKAVSAHNILYNVGNDLGNDPVTPCITFKNPLCISVGDLFDRTDEQNELIERISLPQGIGGIAIDNTKSIRLGSYEREVGLESVFKSPNITVGNLVIGEAYKILIVGDTDFTTIGAVNSLPGTEFIATGIDAGTGIVIDAEYKVEMFMLENLLANSYKVDYNIRVGNDTRFGTISTSVNGAQTIYTDEFTDTTTIPVILRIEPGLDGNSALTASVDHNELITINFSLVRLD